MMNPLHVSVPEQGSPKFHTDDTAYSLKAIAVSMVNLLYTLEKKNVKPLRTQGTLKKNMYSPIDG